MFTFFKYLVNKRLDDWVTEDCLDTRKVQFPRKDGSTTGHNTGVTTPKRQHSISFSNLNLSTNLTASRPTSPKTEPDAELVNGNNVMAAALQKKISRKRKVSLHIYVVNLCSNPLPIPYQSMYINLKVK